MRVDGGIRLLVASAPGADLGDAVMAWATDRGLDARREDGRITAADCDLLVSAGHHYLLPRRILDQPRLGSVGLHPGLLPRYRGSWPLWWAIWDREPTAGLTLYVMDEGIDTGPILAQREVPVGRDTFAELYGRVALEVPSMMDELVAAIRDTGMLPPGTPQDERLATVVRTPGLGLRVAMKVRQWWPLAFLPVLGTSLVVAVLLAPSGLWPLAIGAGLLGAVSAAVLYRWARG